MHISVIKHFCFYDNEVGNKLFFLLQSQFSEAYAMEPVHLYLHNEKTLLTQIKY